MSGLESDLKGLDPEFKKSDVIYDYLLRLLARLPKESAIEFVNLIQKNIKYKSILLQPYLESYLNIYDDVEKIKYFENMLNFSQHDSHTLTLLSLLYARQGNFKTALSLGKEAVYKTPLDEVVYWNLLEVTIMAKRYELSTKVLRVLYEKFDVQLNNEIQAELEQFPDFVESDQYKIWLAENKIIIE
jgi:tetratricopeptide (TPR) repeat protein